MKASIEYHLNKASVVEIAEHLTRCDADFVPTLSLRVEINSYAQKIASKAMRFEAWSGGTLVGMVAAYCNDYEKRIAYLTSVSVLRAWTSQGIAARLVGQCIEYAKASGMRQISLEVARDNTRATTLYGKIGFVAGKGNAPFINMDLNLESEEQHERQA
jgi:ribosomal protein S18 acetylase RimI-like enzyme